MIPYSYTYPAFFSKLHFEFFCVLGSFSKLGVDNRLPLSMSLTPHPYSLHLIFFLFSFFFFFSSHFYNSLFFHVLRIFYKTSFQFFFSFWEHVKTWVRQWVIPLHVPYTPLPIFHTKFLKINKFPLFSFL
jgi:hypothetical protein